MRHRVDFQRVDFETRIVANGQLNPFQARFRRSNPIARDVDFVGWIRRWHEDHSLEAERANDLFGGPKMADVDWVEGPTENSDTSLGLGHSRS